MALLESGSVLAETLAAENAALRALDLATAGGLLEVKTRALAAFVASATAGPVPGELRRRLAGLVLENRTLLERAILVQGRVIGTIARAVPRALAEQPGIYRRDGGTAAAMPAAMALRASA